MVGLTTIKFMRSRIMDWQRPVIYWTTGRCYLITLKAQLIGTFFFSVGDGDITSVFDYIGVTGSVFDFEDNLAIAIFDPEFQEDNALLTEDLFILTTEDDDIIIWT